MSHKIAIISIVGKSIWGECDIERLDIIKHISDWAEVDEETLKLLREASCNYEYVNEDPQSRKFFTVMEQPINQKQFILDTVADYTKLAQAWKAEHDKKKKAEEAKERARTEANKVKTLEQKRKKLEKLRAELGE